MLQKSWVLAVATLLLATWATDSAQDNGAATPGLALFETDLMSRIDDRVVQLDFGAALGFGGDGDGFIPNSHKVKAIASLVLFDGRVRLSGGSNNYLVDDANQSKPVFGVSGTVYGLAV